MAGAKILKNLFGDAAEAIANRLARQEVTASDPMLALHNLTSQKINVADSIGGLAAPSIAIAKPQYGFDSFGDISLIGDEKLITPGPEMRVFSADAYTPRFPEMYGNGLLEYNPDGTYKQIPLTMDEVLRRMNAQPIRNGEELTSAGAIRALVAPEFKTLDEIKENRHRIKNTRDTNSAYITQGVNQNYNKLADELFPYRIEKQVDDWEHLLGMKDAMRDVTENNVDALDAYYRGLPPEVKEQTLSYLQSLPDVPTEYFEAKALRGVPFSEFKAAVVPEGIDRNAMRILENNIPEIKVYDPNKPRSREEALMGFPKYEFSAGGRIAKAGAGKVIGEGLEYLTKAFSGADEVTDALRLAERERLLQASGPEYSRTYEDLSNKGLSQSGYASKLKAGKPIEEYTTKLRTKGTLQPWQETDIEKLVREGASIYPALGDRSAANQFVTEIGGVPLTSPINLQAGGDFGRSEFGVGSDPAFWASRQGAASKMVNRLVNDQLREEGPSYMTHVAMGYPNLDSTHMVRQGVVRAIPNMNISSKDLGLFNETVRKNYPEFPGVENTEEAEAFLNALPGSGAADIVSSIERDKFIKRGFPSLMETRWAVSEPRLMDVPPLTTGYSIGQVGTKGAVPPRALAHETYGKQIPLVGEVSGLKHSVPASIMFPEWWSGLKPHVQADSTKAQHLMMMQFPRQKATQEWLDNLRAYQETHKDVYGYNQGGRVGYGTRGRVVAEGIDYLKNALTKSDDAIRAYHGSPYKFDKFDLSKIGTGEGNQVYGHGLYFASKEDVARWYADALSQGKDPRNAINDVIWQFNDQKIAQPTYENIKDWISDNNALYKYSDNDAVMRRLHEAINATDVDDRFHALKELDNLLPEPTKGSMYEVGIRANPNYLLDWDKPMRDQSAEIRSILDPYATEAAERANIARKQMLAKGKDFMGRPYKPEKLERLNTVAEPGDFRGSAIYTRMQNDLGANSPGDKAPEVSQKLLETGIPGIRYLDGSSRSAGFGTSNFVVFDPSIIDINRRYNQGGSVNDEADIDAALHIARQHKAGGGGIATIKTYEKPEENGMYGALPELPYDQPNSFNTVEQVGNLYDTYMPKSVKPYVDAMATVAGNPAVSSPMGQAIIEARGADPKVTPYTGGDIGGTFMDFTAGPAINVGVNTLTGRPSEIGDYIDTALNAGGGALLAKGLPYVKPVLNAGYRGIKAMLPAAAGTAALTAGSENAEAGRASMLSKAIKSLRDFPKKILPPSEDIYDVGSANFDYYDVGGNATMPIDKLVGGVNLAQPDQRSRVNALKDAISDPEKGYIRRLIVDDEGNVIEGQHRLEALKELGIKEVPVTVLKDLSRGVDTAALKDVIKAQGGINSDNTNQLVGMILSDDPNLYDAPVGFEKYWDAAVNEYNKQRSTPKASGGSVYDNGKVDDSSVNKALQIAAEASV